jgi:hypothetical protein
MFSCICVFWTQTTSESKFAPLSTESTIVTFPFFNHNLNCDPSLPTECFTFFCSQPPYLLVFSFVIISNNGPSSALLAISIRRFILQKIQYEIPYCKLSNNLIISCAGSCFIHKIYTLLSLSIQDRRPEGCLCRWFRFAQLAKGKKFRP